MSVDHYENFPVASWLCPRRLRPPITAIYWFARTADDIADEGDAPAQSRLDDLAAFRDDLHAIAHGQMPSPRWRPIFAPLAREMEAHQLPVSPLADLLSAFEQDVRHTRDDATYATQDELLDYCRRSANPVGRLLLHLYHIDNATALAESDHICTALQLANFWQDLSVDIPRGRHYLPDDACAAHAVTRASLSVLHSAPNTLKLIAEQVHFARAELKKGLHLPKRVPGRAGFELRLVAQGGLAILDRIAAAGHDTLRARPTLGKTDLPRLLWRALTM